MNFSLTMPRKIWFGAGEFARVPSCIQELGRQPLIVCGASQRERAAELRHTLQAAGLTSHIFDAVTGEPTPDQVRGAAAAARNGGCDVVIGLGGGSAMDVAKAAAAMATNDGDIVDYLENVGIGATIRQNPMPFLAIPTTAGTGAEVTKNAVIADPDRGYKSSFRSDRLLAATVVVDPGLCAGAPLAVIAASGMDALTQLIEAYLSKKANAVTDALALDALPMVAAALPRVYTNPEDASAFVPMAYGSLLSGICLANAGLGAAHGIAAALGAVLGIPHGLACAVLLRPVLAANLPHVGSKAAQLCQVLTGTRPDTTQQCVDAVDEFVAQMMSALGIEPRLGVQNVTPELLDKLQNGISTSMSANPVAYPPEQTRQLIADVL